jgi:hypothetical protein
VFLLSGLLIGGNIIYVCVLAPRLQSRAACPPDAPKTCSASSRMSRRVLWVSAAIYSIGALSAYVLGPLLMRFGD